MIEKILKTVEKYKLLENEDKVLVAVSGGPDSILLLRILQDIKTQYNLQLKVVHLNHQLRENAWKEASFVKEQAKKLGIPCIVEEKDVRGYAETHKLSLEEAAREVRYNFFEQTAIKFGMNKIATGHTLSDEVETFVLRVARGAGRKGLLLIPPKRDVGRNSNCKLQIIRPLIEIIREEIIEFLESEEITYQTDESNCDIQYSRNFVRHRIVPSLLELTPQFPKQVMKLREILGEEEELLEQLTEKRLKKIQKFKGSKVQRFEKQKAIEETVLDLEGFLETPLAIKRRILREIYMQIVNCKAHIENYPSFEEIENAIRYIENNKGGKKFNLCKIDISKSCGKIRIVKNEKLTAKNEKLKIELEIPGEVKWDGVKIKCKMQNTKCKVQKFDDLTKVYFDFDEVSHPFWIRKRENGDKIKLEIAEKKLKNVFIDDKIPTWEREKTPLLVDEKGILWIVGKRRSNRANIENDTKKIIEVWVEEEKGSKVKRFKSLKVQRFKGSRV